MSATYVVVRDERVPGGVSRQVRVLADGRVLTRVVGASGSRCFVLSRVPYAWVRYPGSVVRLLRSPGARAWARLMRDVHGR